MQIIALNLLVFCSAFLLVIAFYNALWGQRAVVAERLTQIKKIKDSNAEEDEEELKRPFFERLIKPFYGNLVKGLVKLTPKELRHSIEKKILYAGNPWNMTFNSFIALQLLLIMLFTALVLFLIWIVDIDATRAFLLIILAAAFGMALPFNMVSSRALKRQKQIQKMLPDMLDLLLVSVEAGLSFDLSLKKVAERAQGALSREITRALEEMRLGKTREEALRDIVRRTGSADLNSFISAVIQSEQMGGNLANTLRAQAASLRQKRRQRAEEAAMKAPIKMLFPLVFFIFPALFVVLLGPAALRIMKTFQGLF